MYKPNEKPQRLKIMQKISKQLKYYYRHRKARLEYQRQYYQKQKTKNTTNKTNNEKSYIRKLICADKPRDVNLPQNKDIYSVFDLLNEVLELNPDSKAMARIV